MTTGEGVARWKAAERQRWGDAALPWSRWDQWQQAEQGAERLTHRMLDLAGLRRGDRVLDVATGVGEPALTAAAAVGSGGSVVGIDQAPQMIAMARERASAQGLTNVEFLEMDAEKIDLPDRSFDVILCRWALMLFPDLQGTLEAFRGLLAPAGRLSVAVWGRAEKVPVLSVAPEAARRLLQAPPPSPSLPTPFSLADPARLQSEIVRAGFEVTHYEVVDVCMSFPSTDVFVEYTQQMSKSTLALLSDEPPARRTAVWNEVRAAVQPFINEAGEVRMTNESICLAARRSA